MKVNITYPHAEKRLECRRSLLLWSKWILFAACALCVFLNLVIGGPAWSVIVVWAGWTCWSFLIWPDLVSCNRMSLWIRMVLSAALLLSIIALLFTQSARNGIPLVWFIGESVAGALFFTDLSRQKQNMPPMLLLLAMGLMISVFGMIFVGITWEFIATGIAAVIIIIAGISLLGDELIQAIKKTIHTQ